MTGLDVAQIAKDRLCGLTGFKPDTVSSMNKDEAGWHISVDMVELKRIPEVTDVLATYETVLDDEGNLVSYQRTRRYHRGEVTQDA